MLRLWENLNPIVGVMFLVARRDDQFAVVPLSTVGYSHASEPLIAMPMLLLHTRSLRVATNQSVLFVVTGTMWTKVAGYTANRSVCPSANRARSYVSQTCFARSAINGDAMKLRPAAALAVIVFVVWTVLAIRGRQSIEYAQTRAQIAELREALRRYYADTGSYPTTDQGLLALVSGSDPLDPGMVRPPPAPAGAPTAPVEIRLSTKVTAPVMS